MTISEIKTFLVTVDSTIERYESSKRDTDAYTVWYEVNPGTAFADGKHEDVIKFQVDRFTKTEDDATAAAIKAALDARDDIAFDYLVDYENDTGYIHHIYDCEGC
jgi:hypothetical protein